MTIEELENLIRLESKYVSGHRYECVSFGYRRPEKDVIEFEELKWGCSFGSKFLLNSYAGVSFRRVNEQIRDERWVSSDEFVEEYKRLLNHALEEIPSYKNKVVWRWCNGMGDEEFNYLKKHIGKRVMIPQFLSTSLYKNSAYRYFFEIKTNDKSNGSYIGDLVGKFSEQEVLFKSYSIFLIENMDDDTIYMEELNSNEEYELALYANYWKKNVYTNRAYTILFGKSDEEDIRFKI